MQYKSAYCQTIICSVQPVSKQKKCSFSRIYNPMPASRVKKPCAFGISRHHRLLEAEGVKKKQAELWILNAVKLTRGCNKQLTPSLSAKNH